MTRENIIDRIKKLLALAKDNPSVAEATSAALKAQQLIAKYDIAKDELYAEEPDAIEQRESFDIHGKPWATYLARAIADNFRCKHYFNDTTSRNYWTRRKSVDERKCVFVGYETDAEAARVTFERLYEIGEKLADAECRRVKRLYGTARGVRNSFLVGDNRTTGFVAGIRSELEKQCKELMLVRPQAVNDYYDEISTNFGTLRSSLRSQGYSNAAASRGYEAGRDSLRSARMGGQLALEG